MSTEKTVQVRVFLPVFVHTRIKEKQAERRRRGLPFLTISQLAMSAILDGLLREETEKK